MNRGGVAKAMHQHSKDFDLIAVLPQAKAKVSFGRITGKIVQSGDVPVLIIPEEDLCLSSLPL